MAKYEQPFEDTQTLFTNVIRNAGLAQYLNITVLTNNKTKDIFTINKASELLKFRTGDDVIIVINENILDKLPKEQKLIVVEEAIAYISYDTENDKIVITKPDFMAHTGILRKYGFDAIDVIRESVKTLFQVEKQNEEEAKTRV